MVHAHTATGPSPSPARYPTRFASRMHLSPQPTASAIGQAFPRHHARNPRRVSHTHGLAIIRFRSPLLTEYPLLQVLRCFTSLRTPRTTMRCQPMTAGGLPHSDTLGSKPCRRLPQDYRGPTRPSSVLSAKASTIRPSRQPQQIIMTKALLKNPRTTSDHGSTPNTACFHTIRTNPRKQSLGFESQYEHQPHPHGRADARVHYPVLKPPPHQDTHPHQQAPGSQPGGQPGDHTPPHTGGRWRPGNPTARTTPHNPIRLFHASKGQARTTTVRLQACPKHRTQTASAHNLRRKEVIQPHLPVRLPCYDLVPITSLTLDGSPHEGRATGFGCYPLS